MSSSLSYFDGIERIQCLTLFHPLGHACAWKELINNKVEFYIIGKIKADHTYSSQQLTFFKKLMIRVRIKKLPSSKQVNCSHIPFSWWSALFISTASHDNTAHQRTSFISENELYIWKINEKKQKVTFLVLGTTAKKQNQFNSYWQLYNLIHFAIWVLNKCIHFSKCSLKQMYMCYVKHFTYLGM